MALALSRALKRAIRTTIYNTCNPPIASPMNPRIPGLMAALATSLLVATEPFAQRRASQAEPRALTSLGALLPAEQSTVRLFETAAPSVAYINTERLEPTSFFTVGVAKGAGSGFVWDTHGHVVTNFHVVEGARTVQVQLDAGKSYSAKVVGVAPDYDLAVVKLAQVPAGLRPIPLRTSTELRLGQSVYAIGNPFGLTRTLTSGLVSALDRHLPTSDIREIAGAIQTDAAINPGNSGGPLLDSAGRLVGVTTAIRSPSRGSTGVGLTIPVDLGNRIVPQLIAHGRAPQPGIGIHPADPDQVARAGIQGVVSVPVNLGSPAATAGLEPTGGKGLGDLLVAVNGRPVEALPTFAAELDRVGI